MNNNKKDLRAFTLIECIIVLILIGVVGAIAFPMFLKKDQIEISKYYEAYRLLHEAAYKVRLISPTQNVRVVRSTDSNWYNTCDYFADIISIIGEPTERPKNFQGDFIENFGLRHSGCSDTATATDLEAFDSPTAASLNFITINGLRFYGISGAYPTLQQPEKLMSNEEADTLNPPRRQYRNIYVDVNGIPSNQDNGRCNDVCNCAQNNDGVTEHNNCQTCYSCLRDKYGVYKFRLYKNGAIEPMTERNTAGNALENRHANYAYYKLSFIRNGETITPNERFATYAEARAYKLPANSQTFRYSEIGANFNTEWRTITLAQPCLNFRTQNADGTFFNNFMELDCEILPVTAAPTLK